MRVMYAGSFDPLTKGHMSIISEAQNLFDEIVIAILVNNAKKNYLFSLKERLELIKKIYEYDNKIQVIASNLPCIDVAKKYNCQALVRGIRTSQDTDYELTLAKINKELSENNLSTVCLFGNFNYNHVSSTLVKELYNMNKSVTNYIDPIVENALRLKRSNNGN